MYSKLKPFSFMGVSNSEMFLSENKDVSSTMEFSFLVRPPLEFQEDDQCQIATFQDVDDEPQQQKEERVLQEEDKCTLLMAPVELKLPCSGEFKVHENGEEDAKNDGFKTPTSLDHKIPVMLKCPPAPKKPKSLPISPKRKAFRPRILLDFTKEIESLFPPALLADLGNKIKKVRQGSDFK
ncbi:cyclin-dependent protein kinase inhibitor SMR3-like [Durio zibethinus]|uniref:Cyclin-dependent protein kinase inhibitor SMR3-like n=1 Tax=Durio zibethinus TaxID=66656 RepID=A0A6P5XUF6_DURZI|nr:cyclin-dependent protein kinase inhibitor SMR3-like [Durio zibethinus]